VKFGAERADAFEQRLDMNENAQINFYLKELEYNITYLENEKQKAGCRRASKTSRLGPGAA
jgi:primosomal protein N''